MNQWYPRAITFAIAALFLSILYTPIAHTSSIAAGNHFTCAIKSNKVYCWGANDSGQSGADPTQFASVAKPIAVEMGSSKIPDKIAAGRSHACILFTDKTGKCWGSNTSGQLGNGTFTNNYKAVDIWGGSAMEEIVAGDATTCARVTNGAVYCWGKLAQPNNTVNSFNVPTPYYNGAAGPIAASNLGYCAAYQSSPNYFGNMGCFGMPTFTVGLKYTSPQNITATAKIMNTSFVNQAGAWMTMPGSSEIKELGVGNNFACALTKAGQTVCAGEYFLPITGSPITDIINKTLGLQASPNLTSFVLVSNVNDARSLSVGHHHGCVVRQSGQAACWGGDWMGELGQGSIKSTASAVPVQGISSAIEVAAGYFHSCARLKSGDIQCWGSTAHNAIGPEPSVPGKSYATIANFCEKGIQSCGYVPQPVTITGWPTPPTPTLPQPITAPTSSKPAEVSFKSPVVQKNTLAAGSKFTCELKNGVIQCAGSNTYGQLGNGQTNIKPAVKPVKVALGTAAQPISISAGIANACTILSDQSLLCWGANAYGQLGNGTTADSNIPTPVKALGPVARVALGGSTTCAVTPTGQAYCWGSGSMGQVGNANNRAKNVVPTKVSGPAGIMDVQLGDEFACALRDNGQVYCWGANTYGQLGNGSKNPSNIPVAVKDGNWSKYINGATSLAVGARHACVVLADKTGRCWGDNAHGQLGINQGTASTVTVATPIYGGSAMEEIVANDATTCTRVTNGQVYCWGNNNYGQFGNKDPSYAVAPVPAFNGQKVLALTLGAQHACVTLVNGRTSCSGSNLVGQMKLDLTQTTMPPTTDGILAKMVDLHHQLIAAISLANTASSNLDKTVFEALEPSVKAMISGSTPPKLTPNESASQLQAAALAAAEDQVNIFLQITDLLTTIIPPQDTTKVYDAATRDIYTQAIGIYLSALISQGYDWPTQIPNCTTGIIEKEKLLDYMTNFSKDISKAKTLALDITRDLQCLTPSSAATLGSAIYSSYKMVSKTFEKWRPAYAQPVKDSLLVRFAPILFSLEDITKSQFPEDPAILMLGDYVTRLNTTPPNKAINEYGIAMDVPFLFMRNPTIPLAQDSFGIPEMGIPFCPQNSQTPVPQFPKVQTGNGEKNKFGALMTDVTAQACNNTAKPWPVWKAYTNDPNNVYQGCMVFRNFANMYNPVLLGDGTCKDWNTLRLGKPCCTPAKPKTSFMERKQPSIIRNIAATIENVLASLWISTAHAQDRSTPWFQRGPRTAPTNTSSTTNDESRSSVANTTAPLNPTQPAIPDTPRNPSALPQDPDAAATENSICPPDRCFIENNELVFRNPLGTEYRYPNMTRERFVALQLQRMAASKTVEDILTKGPEALRDHLLQTAPLVIRGTPTAQLVETPPNAPRRTIYTIAVAEVMRGSLEQSAIAVVVPGGCLSTNNCETVLGLRMPQANQEALFLLYPIGQGQWGLLNLDYGVGRVENGRIPDWNIDLSTVRERNQPVRTETPEIPRTAPTPIPERSR